MVKVIFRTRIIFNLKHIEVNTLLVSASFHCYLLSALFLIVPILINSEPFQIEDFKISSIIVKVLFTRRIVINLKHVEVNTLSVSTSFLCFLFSELFLIVPSLVNSEPFQIENFKDFFKHGEGTI